MNTPQAQLTHLNPTGSKKRFCLTLQNEKGQVAVFVALIFQVVFIFFALLINVGLLVHHKINLQHSTDLAAYYGAMKQAEQLNAISHINFQMRQAWKLLTWRYRILGTFGFSAANDGSAGPNPNASTAQVYPFDILNGQFKFNGSQGTFAQKGNEYINGTRPMTCESYAVGAGKVNDYRVNGTFIGMQDVPFFCIAHSGINTWPEGDSQCQLNCEMLTKARPLALLPTVNDPGSIPFTSNVASSVNITLGIVNKEIKEKCDRLGITGAQLLAKFLVAYTLESVPRSETIKMLAANLTGDVGRFVDLDGSLIREGSERTFKNNLTGANFTGLSSGNFKAYNGLNANACRFSNGNSFENRTEFLKKIDFDLINFFIHSCSYTTDTKVEYKPINLYDSSNTTSGLSRLFENSNLTPAVKNILTSFLIQNSRFTTGYEKNPNCVEYYAVSSSSEPTIPFLPISKIRLTATSVAKPFGGSIGPSFGEDWPIGAPKSTDSGQDPLKQIDMALPRRTFVPGQSLELKDSVFTQPNFSLFVGDRLGLRNLDYIATYHSMLVKRDIAGYPNKNYTNFLNTTAPAQNTHKRSPWPAYDNWSKIDQPPSDVKEYDSLATADSNAAGTRAIEITAIAPNQFDLAYYSIDPDYYNNYYVKLYKNFDKIRQASGATVALTKDQLRADFGAFGMDGQLNNGAALTEKSFSVKDQILLKNIVLNKVPSTPPQHTLPGTRGGSKYSDFLNYLVSFPASLLTGWTFLRFDDYRTFPKGPVDKTGNTMTFGQCADSWNDGSTDQDKVTDNKFERPASAESDNPPVPGNCVTGGRTGYSVKLVSPSVVLDGSKLLNPIDRGFFNF